MEMEQQELKRMNMEGKFFFLYIIIFFTQKTELHVGIEKHSQKKTWISC